MWKRLSTARKKAFIITGSVLTLLIVLFLLFVNSFLKPILREKLHTLIVRGSDSLYTYTLGDIKPGFLGSNVVVENLQLRIDSNRYRQLVQRNALPALTFELNLVKGSVQGIGLIPLLTGRLSIGIIKTSDATLTLVQHNRPGNELENDPPLWKTIQPAIKSIRIGKIDFDNVKLQYRNADTAQSARLRFEKFYALLEHIRIDSAASVDSNRVLFARNIKLQLQQLAVVTADSLYRLTANAIAYTSQKKQLEVQDFHMQPVLGKEAFYQKIGFQRNLNNIRLRSVQVLGFSLGRMMHEAAFIAQSVAVDQPSFTIYLDKSFAAAPGSKIPQSPQQILLESPYKISIGQLQLKNGTVLYTEKNGITGQEGTVALKQLDISCSNITNDSLQIRKQPHCLLEGKGTLMGSSITGNFTFYLDSSEGAFDGKGTIGKMQAAQLNPLSVPLAAIRLSSFDLQQLSFSMHGDKLTAVCDLNMQYRNLAAEFLKIDPQSGKAQTKKMITNLFNKYVLYPSNPGADGVERKAVGIKRTRTSAQSFTALIWLAMFGGLQYIMMQSS